MGLKLPSGLGAATKRAAVMTFLHSGGNWPLAIAFVKLANAFSKPIRSSERSIALKWAARQPEMLPLEPQGNDLIAPSMYFEENSSVPGT